MSFSPQAEAVIQVARKRQLQDQIGCARLRVLLSEHGVRTLAQTRAFLQDARILPAGIAQQLLARLPHGPMTMGGYQLLAHLAEGGMGSAWLACRTHPLEGRGSDSAGIYQAHNLVVIKTIRPKFIGSEEVRYRFERECRFMAALRHPHVVAVLDHGIHEDGTMFMVLEFIPEGDLKDLIVLDGRLPEALALSITYQLADALDETHKADLIHRDIKPANIFICPEHVCKLADFGLARSTASDRTALTVEGETLGSLHYMSPEQARGDQDLDIRSDLYALGCVLFYCLCGSKPYVGDDMSLMHQHRFAPVPDPLQFRSNLGRRTADVIMRLMAKDRTDRFQTPAELRSALADTMQPLREAEPDPALPVTLRMVRPAVEDADPTATTRNQAQRRHDDPFSSTIGTVTAPAVPVPPSPFPADGDLADALDAPWITLAGDGCLLFLYARHHLILGKLCEPPVDICVRKYPIEEFRQDCMRISRLHLDVRFDAALGSVTVTDRDSGNGTLIDGQPMRAHAPLALRPGVLQVLRLAEAVDLEFRVTGREGPGPDPILPLAGGGAPSCGLECGHALDACVIRRPGNRPGMAYAMVLRQLTVGGERSDIPLAEAQGPGAVIALIKGRWIWRPLDQGRWRPLCPGVEMDLAGKRLVAEAGGHTAF